MTKTCENCGVEFPRPSKTGIEAWGKRRFCGNECHNQQRGREAREHLHGEVAWIVDHDHPESVARRVGYGKVEDLMHKLRRTGGEELAEKLARNLDRYARGGAGYRDREFA